MMTNEQKRQLEMLYSTQGVCRFEEPMAEHTTFRIGGPAEIWLVPDSVEQLQKTVTFLKQEGIRMQILGNGSNVLVSDEGVRGAVIRMEDRRSKVLYDTDGEVTMATAPAGMSLSAFAREVCDKGYAEMEYATGIPGSVGGAIVMNAGAYEGEIRNQLQSAKVLTEDGEIVNLTAEDLKLSYRYSIIPEKRYLVLSGTFALKPGNRDEIRAKVLDLATRRREKQPLEYPSAGSTFKRPEGNYAGKLIQESGLRGYRVGDAMVSEKHCGFVINAGAATASEVKQLIADVQRIVQEKTGILLEPEVKFLE